MTQADILSDLPDDYTFNIKNKVKGLPQNRKTH